MEISMNNKFYPERSRKIREDAAKWTLILPKLMLEYLCFWPELQSKVSKIVSFCLLINVTFLMAAHTAYFIEHIKNIVKVAELITTVNIVTQGFVKMATLISHRNRLRILLHIVWHEFWPSDILKPNENRKLKKITLRYFIAVGMFSIGAFCTTPQFMYQPLILGVRALPLMIKLPFSVLDSPTFELFYVWICCTCLGTVQFILVGFDLLFTMLVWNCSIQFKILRILLQRFINEKHFKTEKEVHQEENEETKRLIKYIQYHQKLIDICNELEDMFKYILLLQLLDSAVALCFCCFTAVTLPVMFAKMVTFSFAYLMQLFLYCAFGNELIHQSETLAYAVFQSGWHYSRNRKIGKLLLLLMQKSQAGKRLTATGFAVVNYASFLQVIKMAFSFYTVLDTLKKKNKQP